MGAAGVFRRPGTLTLQTLGERVATKEDLQEWIVEALTTYSGRATLVDVARHIWSKHEAVLRTSGDLFFTWQYDMRWAANILRRKGVLRWSESSRRGVWELADE